MAEQTQIQNQDRITLILAGGRLLNPAIPAGALRGVEEEMEATYGKGCLDNEDFIENIGWRDHDVDGVDDPVKLLRKRKFDPAFTQPQELFERLGPKAHAIGLQRVTGFIPGEPFDHIAFHGTAALLQKRLEDAGIDAEVVSHNFNRAEHAVLSAYFNRWPAEAVESLGTDALSPEVLDCYAEPIAGGVEERRIDAAVATVALRSIEKELPWYTTADTIWQTGSRRKRPRRDKASLSLIPKHILTIDWSLSAPGYSWPTAYHLCWVPIYDKYVVTAAADSYEARCGHIDLAICSFAPGGDLTEEVRKAIIDDWSRQAGDGQERWELVWEEGLVSKDLARQYADEVWPPYEEEEEWDDEEVVDTSA